MSYTTLVIKGEYTIRHNMLLGAVTVVAGAHYNAIEELSEMTEFLETIIESKYDSIDDVKDAALEFMMKGNE